MERCIMAHITIDAHVHLLSAHEIFFIFWGVCCFNEVLLSMDGADTRVVEMDMVEEEREEEERRR